MYSPLWFRTGFALTQADLFLRSAYVVQYVAQILIIYISKQKVTLTESWTNMFQSALSTILYSHI
jgi:hypothetical protein